MKRAQIPMFICIFLKVFYNACDLSSNHRQWGASAACSSVISAFSALPISHLQWIPLPSKSDRWEIQSLRSSFVVPLAAPADVKLAANFNAHSQNQLVLTH